jgi:hypothetical protein
MIQRDKNTNASGHNRVNRQWISRVTKDPYQNTNAKKKKQEESSDSGR